MIVKRLLVVVLAILVPGLWGVEVEIRAVPPVVRRGGYVTLQCLYRLQGASLYTVKWYRGLYEFYRFVPKEIPTQQIYHVKGINVDLTLSNDTQVMLREMEFDIAGNFTCEVSADAPTFSTATATIHVYVVSPPESGPIIRTERNQYRPGDLFKANCSASPSKPAANLTFFINNEAIDVTSKRVHLLDDNLEWSDVSISTTITPNHFKTGKMVIRCIAQMSSLYIETSNITFVLPADVKSERSLWGVKVMTRAVPPVVRRGGYVTLQCLYKMQGAPLYSVKWYKGRSEFYRFMPKEIPIQKVYHGKGINVDLTLSNDSQVVLREMEFDAAGNFTCEVSADAPTFSTATATLHVDVVSPPKSGPIIRTERNKYRSGDLFRANCSAPPSTPVANLACQFIAPPESGPIIRTERNQYRSGDLFRANCSAPPSRPAANLTFFINNEVMDVTSKMVHPSLNGFEWSDISISTLITSNYFKTGKMVIRCVAQLSPLYIKQSSITFVSLADPKSERITSPSSAQPHCRMDFLLKYVLLIILFFTIVKGQYNDYFSYDANDMDSFDVYDDIDTILVG